MKWLLLLLLVGVASAEYYDAVFEDVSDTILSEFLSGLQKTPSLAELFGSEYSEEAKQLEEDIRSQMVTSLKEVLETLVAKIGDVVKIQKVIAKDMIEKVKTELLRLKDVKAGRLSKEVLENVKGVLKRLLHNLNTDNRSATAIAQTLLMELDMKSLFQKLQEKLTEKLNVSQLRDYVEKTFGKANDLGKNFLEVLRTHSIQDIKDLVSWILFNNQEEVEVHKIGKRWITIARAACLLVKYAANGWTKNKIIDWINNNVDPKWRNTLINATKIGIPTLKLVLGRLCGRAAAAPYPSESIIKLWNRIREFFQNLGLEVQEKFFRFAEWARITVKGGLEKVQDKLERIKIVAREVIKNSKSMSREVASEALEFFRPYKSDLGVLWDQLKDATTNVIQG